MMFSRKVESSSETVTSEDKPAWTIASMPVGTTFTIDGVVGATNWNDAIGMRPGTFGKKVRVTVEVVE